MNSEESREPGQVTIVLVEPSHPGNIGAAARAMKVMGLRQLILVKPSFFPDAQATAMAAGADDLLAQAQVCDSLAEALSNYQLIIGTSARCRAQSLPRLTPHAMGQLVVQQEADGVACAIVFGRESSGLRNEELTKCHYQVQIPSCIGFNSLNLAASVQVISYEYRLSVLERQQQLDGEQQLSNGTLHGEATPLAKAGEVEHLMQHTRQLLAAKRFTQDAAHLDKMLLKMRHIYQRAQLSNAEVAMLEGMLSAYEQN